MTVALLPALDVAGGQVVSMMRARPGSETWYGSPLEVAHAWQHAGVSMLHVVDVDAALGRGSNTSLISEIVAELSVPVEVSGGIRDDASLTAALATGCARVNLSTAALDNFGWCARVIREGGQRIAIELDVQVTSGQHRLRGRGSPGDSGDLWETLDRLISVGCDRYVVTDVTRDGTLSGPNIDLLRRVCAGVDAPVVASGGVATLDDLEAICALATIGVEAVIVGTAPHSGRFTVREAMAAVG